MYWHAGFWVTRQVHMYWQADFLVTRHGRRVSKWSTQACARLTHQDITLCVVVYYKKQESSSNIYSRSHHQHPKSSRPATKKTSVMMYDQDCYVTAHLVVIFDLQQVTECKRCNDLVSILIHLVCVHTYNKKKVTTERAGNKRHTALTHDIIGLQYRPYIMVDHNRSVVYIRHVQFAGGIEEFGTCVEGAEASYTATTTIQ